MEATCCQLHSAPRRQGRSGDGERPWGAGVLARLQRRAAHRTDASNRTDASIRARAPAGGSGHAGRRRLRSKCREKAGSCAGAETSPSLRSVNQRPGGGSASVQETPTQRARPHPRTREVLPPFLLCALRSHRSGELVTEQGSEVHCAK